MSNVNNPHGMRPLMRTMDGGAPQTRAYLKSSGYAFGIFKWDPVTLVAGYLKGPASGITVGTTRFLGVALDYSLASLAATLHVMDSRDAVFELQGDGSGSSPNFIDQTTVGYKANLNIGTAGGGVTRDNSGVMLTESTIATTSTLDVLILGLLEEVSGNAFGAYGRVEVVFNKHLHNPEVTST